ncbi:Resistance to inhibitors of cholinesterase like protein [Argiope bruennichi]|uniref:Resistance to inhibitors of cholinesterase like protein n=1 Tax=Argiope bruennichi TaxID=94029 RepID=A0A8T0FS83_ARGBR|nr:Resistance to inhibitors of cholinesterase like protein [Argiope bruennichi]
MSQADFGTGKSLVVLAIVLGCFAVLWPKIFYPMMQTAFAMTSPKVDSDGRFHDADRPPHLHPASAGPRGRGPSSDDVHDKFLMREGRPFPHPQARQPAKSQPKSGGAMSIIMPIYTVGIVVFFLYTVLKLVFKKPNEGDKKPLIKDFHMDPEYRKFVYEPSASELIKAQKLEKKNKKNKLREPTIPENEIETKDFEIFKLKKKLEETEQAMERIIKHMGVVNACLNERVQLEKKIIDTQSTDIRQRHKGSSQMKVGASLVSDRNFIQELNEENESNHCSVKKLEDDLSELISLCSAKDKSCEKSMHDPETEDDEDVEKSDESSDDSEDKNMEQKNSFNENEHKSVNGCCKNLSCA